MSILLKVQEKHGRFLSEIDKIVVGVSGGADSLALLYVLWQIVGRERLVVAHLDHGWRESSRGDAAFVRNTAVSLNIPYHEKRLKNNKQDGSLEAIGRQERYRFFADVARCEGTNFLAVAHHQNDQVETLLMHLIRGSGLLGLRGMQFETQFDSLRVLRPFLHIRREEIEAYCRANHLVPRHDETNDDPSFLRNRIRQTLVPSLKTYNPKIETHVAQLSQLVTADVALLSQLANEKWSELGQNDGEGWLTIDRSAWLELPLALRRRILRIAVKKLGASDTEVGFQTIEDARLGLENGHFGDQFQLPTGLVAMNLLETILFKWADIPFPLDLPQMNEGPADLLAVPGECFLANGWRITAVFLETPHFNQIINNNNPWQAFILPPSEPLEVRGRREGDKIRPLGLNGRSRLLKKVMIDARIPAQLREKWPLVSTKDAVVWIPGKMLNNHFRLKGDEEKILHLQCFSVTK